LDWTPAATVHLRAFPCISLLNTRGDRASACISLHRDDGSRHEVVWMSRSFVTSRSIIGEALQG
jgi:hypothetical protein